MASSIHRQTVSVIDTITKTVVLYPSQALVTREVSNIELKPGTNEVEIYGLTPTLDQHSIKVDGIGSASVTDMTVDLVPNKQSFAELYEDDLEIEMSDPENESDDDEKLDIVVRTLKVDLAALQDKFNSELVCQPWLKLTKRYLLTCRRPIIMPFSSGKVS